MEIEYTFLSLILIFSLINIIYHYKKKQNPLFILKPNGFDILTAISRIMLIGLMILFVLYEIFKLN